MSVEFPGTPVPPDSKFYINRPPIEELSYKEISKPGSIIRIKAPRKMGKTSLLTRIIAHATTQGYQTVSLDFNKAEEAVFDNLDKFLRWFCANVSHQLNLESKLDDYWDEDIGSKVSCTIYFQGYLLEQINSALVLALNEVNRVFEHPQIAQEFLPLLRSWHEEAQQNQVLSKLRLVVIHSTEIYISLNINQSPFNIGLPIKLPQFSLAQVQDLAIRHGLDWANSEVGEQRLNLLLALVGGHPYLVRLAFYYLVNSSPLGGLEQLLQEAPTLSGIYSSHLRTQLATLQEHPELAAAFKQVVTANNGTQLEAVVAYKLESMGLVELEGNIARSSCDLYRQYFSAQLLDNLYDSRLQKLEKDKQELQELLNRDELTQLANRRCFDSSLHQEWQRALQAGNQLSLILCDIDYFKIYNKAHGHLTGDFCLQQIASTIFRSVQHPANLVARYEGGKFAVILPQTNEIDAVQIAKIIHAQVKDLKIAHDGFLMGGLLPIVTVSLGVSTIVPSLENDELTLVKAAEQALYQAKRQGRNQVVLGSV